MSAPTTVLVHLDADEYERLAAEARRRGVPPDSLAHDLLRAGLPTDETDAERRRRLGLEALEQLARLRSELRRAGYPTVDAEKLVRDGRDDLDTRLIP